MAPWLQLVLTIALVASTSLGALGSSFKGVIAGSPQAVLGHELVSRSQAGVGAASGVIAKARQLAGDVGHVLSGRSAPAPTALFDAGSITWELGQRRALLFGGQRAILMQVADPGLAAGVLDFSSFRTDALGRLKRTMDAMDVIQYGRADEAEKMLTRLERMHRRVRGVTPDGSAYSAQDPQLQYWVLATLVDSALEVERRFVGQFNDAERARYFESSKKLAYAFGLTDEHIPTDYADFRRYMNRRVQQLQPTAQAKEIAQSLFRPAVPLVPKAAFAPLEWVTVDMMPTTMAKRYGFGELSALQSGLVATSQRVARNVTRFKDGVSGLRLSPLAADLPRLRP